MREWRVELASDLTRDQRPDNIIGAGLPMPALRKIVGCSIQELMQINVIWSLVSGLLPPVSGLSYGLSYDIHPYNLYHPKLPIRVIIFVKSHTQ